MEQRTAFRGEESGGYWLKEGEMVGLKPYMHRTLDTDNSMLMARGGQSKSWVELGKGEKMGYSVIESTIKMKL